MILQGYFRILNFFDIAEAIELDKLRALLGPEAGPLTAAFRHRTPEYSQAQQAPIVESVGSVTLLTNDKLEARIKYYWFGVAAVELTAVFECDLDDVCARSFRWMNAPEVEEAAEKLLREHLDRFGPALVRPSPKWLDEDYLIIDVESAKHRDGHLATAAELLDSYSDQIAKLVRGEVVSLSTAERDEIVRSALSYYPNDLVVVGWAAALVYDKPEATPAVIEIREIENRGRALRVYGRSVQRTAHVCARSGRRHPGAARRHSPAPGQVKFTHTPVFVGALVLDQMSAVRILVRKRSDDWDDCVSSPSPLKQNQEFGRTENAREFPARVPAERSRCCTR